MEGPRLFYWKYFRSRSGNNGFSGVRVLEIISKKTLMLFVQLFGDLLLPCGAVGVVRGVVVWGG